MNWYIEALKKYAVFSGRSRRQEYWYFVLFTTLIGIALVLVDTMIFGPDGTWIFTGIYALATLIPNIAATVRRLHDANFSGWWYFITMVPFVGGLWLLYLLVQDSAPDNQYGMNPKLAA